MATLTVTHKQVIEGVAVVQILEPINFEVGQSVTLTNMGAPFNGTHKILALPEYYLTGVSDEGDYQYDFARIITNQVLFALNTDDLERQAVTAGNATYSITCTWIALGDLEDYLGYTFTNPSADLDIATMAVGAANAFAYRRRQESGYFDSPSTVPGLDVKLGTAQYAAILYREKGSVEALASFDPLATGGPVAGNFGQIMRLLGVNKPQVA
jgi:hypothetical protein